MNLIRAATNKTVDPAKIHAPNSFFDKEFVLKIRPQ